MFKKILLIFTILTTFAFADGRDFINNLIEQTNKILVEKDDNRKYLDFINNNIDIDWISNFVLGVNAKSLNEVEKQEFKILYSKYLLQNYVSKIKDYSKRAKITKVDEKSKTISIVNIDTKDATGTSLSVDFRITNKNGKFLIIDIIPEGISFIGSQRTDVGGSIQKLGYKEFIKELKKKIK
ncbi:MAG: ABC transporter substrate-binding protein [Rickettsiales bacterium]|jgi:phospholipid transport system substrate-binding protein|nr:ABC transporter substrate-binding protein [Rickettsiales bacterium]